MNCPKCRSAKIEDYRCGVCGYTFQEGDRLSADGSITYTETKWRQKLGECIDLTNRRLSEREAALIKAKTEAMEKTLRESMSKPHEIEGSMPPEPIIYGKPFYEHIEEKNRNETVSACADLDDRYAPLPSATKTEWATLELRSFNEFTHGQEMIVDFDGFLVGWFVTAERDGDKDSLVQLIHNRIGSSAVWLPKDSTAGTVYKSGYGEWTLKVKPGDRLGFHICKQGSHKNYIATFNFEVNQ